MPHRKESSAARRVSSKFPPKVKYKRRDNVGIKTIKVNKELRRNFELCKSTSS